MVVVCTKVRSIRITASHGCRQPHIDTQVFPPRQADHVTALTRNAHLTEEQAEYIQQTLRTICLQCTGETPLRRFQTDSCNADLPTPPCVFTDGAALFFTSRLHPETFERLRAYILHRLYTTPTPFNPSTTQYANVPSTPTSSKTPAAVPLPQSTRHQYPFPYRANAVHRSTLLIPAGWDTWGKIRALRDDFSPETTLSGWMADIGMQAAEELEGNGTSLARVWRDYIVDVEASSLPPSSTHTKIEAQDEQDFLRLHYDILKREAAKPGATRGGPPGGGATTVRTKSPYATSDAGQNSVAQAAARLFGNSQPANGMPLAGVVGPMASTTLDMPTVERALDRESSAANPGESASNSNSAAGRGMARSRRVSDEQLFHVLLSPLTCCRLSLPGKLQRLPGLCASWGSDVSRMHRRKLSLSTHACLAQSWRQRHGWAFFRTE